MEGRKQQELALSQHPDIQATWTEEMIAKEIGQRTRSSTASGADNALGDVVPHQVSREGRGSITKKLRRHLEGVETLECIGPCGF